MSSPVGVLKPELLYLILFGPGYGESMVVRVPPNHWVVIDSLMLSGSGEVPALELLRDRGAQWSEGSFSPVFLQTGAGFSPFTVLGTGGLKLKLNWFKDKEVATFRKLAESEFRQLGLEPYGPTGAEITHDFNVWGAKVDGLIDVCRKLAAWRPEPLR